MEESNFQEVEPGLFVSYDRTRIVRWPEQPLDDPDEQVWVVVDVLTKKQIAVRRSEEVAQAICDFLYEDQVATTEPVKMRAFAVNLDPDWNPWGLKGEADEGQ